VTKTISPDAVEAAFNLGVRHFGENRVQEAEKKIRALSHLQPRPNWNLIGHLQSNKVRSALELFCFIHSVDSMELAATIDRRAQKKTPVLLQVNIAEEKTKSGFTPDNIASAFETISGLPMLEIQGLMTIAPLVIMPKSQTCIP
jgi:pyridoxal phosphate enzyme (YggS family)